MTPLSSAPKANGWRENTDWNENANLEKNNHGKTVLDERPDHILPINDTPHNICVCTTHSNYTNSLLAISETCDRLSQNSPRASETGVM
ncbi:hypothetical protein HHI36_017147 [Cryptolaemus montrouzieri]|uniref:Uncharacterized protein n=1 Tax=Cryptolaemus montrouzieri TaxID=559131 RepID=A0ABD2NMP8_9CUCU